MMTVEHAMLVMIGLVAGAVGGLLGVGGSVVMIPAMTLLIGPDQHVYQGAAMIVNLFVALPAVLQHHRAGAILWPIARWMAPTAVVSVLIGVQLSAGGWFHGPGEVHLSRLFGLFLLYVVAYNAYRLASNARLPEMDEQAAARLPRWRAAMLVGVPTGLLGGLLGIGGGAVAVPLQQVVLKVPLRRAIANSAFTIIPLSILGATYKNYTNYDAGLSLGRAVELAAFLAPTGMLGGYLGAWLTHAMPRRGLRVFFIVLMCYAGWKMLARPFPPPVTQPAAPPVAAPVASPPAGAIPALQRFPQV